MSTKDKLFTCKIESELLEQFQGATEYLDTTASQAVRGFMRDYVKKAHKQKLADDQQQLSFSNSGGE